MVWPYNGGNTLIRPSSTDHMNDAGFEGDVVIDRLADQIDLHETWLGYLGASSASSVASRLINLEVNYIPTSQKGASAGVAPLVAGRVPVAYLGASPTAGFLRYDGTFANPTDPDPAPVTINPSSSTYGAVMNGTTDDTAAIQKCFDSFSAVANSGIPVVVVIPQGKVVAFSRKTGAAHGLQMGDNQVLRIDGVLKWLAPYATSHGPMGNAGNVSGGMIVNRTTGGLSRTTRAGIIGTGILDGNAAGMFAATATGNRVFTRSADGSNTGTAFTSIAGGLTGYDNYFVVFRSGANAGRAYRIDVTSATAGTLVTADGGAAPSNSTNADWDLYGPDVWDGIRFGSTDQCFVEGITIRDVFGWSSGPPGETALCRIYSSVDARVVNVKVHSTAYTAVGVRGTTAATYNAYTATGLAFTTNANSSCINCRAWCLDAHGHGVHQGNDHKLINFHSFGNAGYDMQFEHTSGTIDNAVIGGYLDSGGSRGGWYSGLNNLGFGTAYAGMMLDMNGGSGSIVVTVNNPRILGQNRAGIGIHIGGGSCQTVASTTQVTLTSQITYADTDWPGCTAWLLRADNTRLGPLTVSSAVPSGGTTLITFTGAHGASVGETLSGCAVDTFAAISIVGGQISRCTTGIYCLSSGSMAKLRAAELTRIDPSVLMVGNTNNFGSMGMGYTDGRYDADTTHPRVISTNTTLTPNDEVVFVDSTSASVTVTLPSYYTSTGAPQRVTILKSAAANAVTIACNGSARINGATTKVLSAQYDKVTLMMAPSIAGAINNWYVIA